MKESEDECQNGKINIDSLVDPFHNKSDDDLETCIKASNDGNLSTKSNLKSNLVLDIKLCVAQKYV
jgi:hypothetical protein